jgi:hypothetical protein
MIMSKKKESKEPFDIVPDTIPKSQKQSREPAYDALVSKMLGMPKGEYRIDFSSKKPLTLYQSLTKKLKDKKDIIEVHYRAKEKKVYIKKKA